MWMQLGRIVMEKTGESLLISFGYLQDQLLFIM